MTDDPHDDVNYDGPERRKDLPTRRRVVDIQTRQDMALKHMWVAIIVLYVVMAFGGFELWRLYHGIQASRVQNIALGCQRDNRSNATTRGLIQQNAASLRQLEREGTINVVQLRRLLVQNTRSKSAYPIVGDCDAYARHQAAARP